MATDDAHKTCVRCQRLKRPAIKLLSAFPANPKTRDGKSSWCQQCATEYRRQWLAGKSAAELARWKQEQREKRQKYDKRRRWAELLAASVPGPMTA